MSPEQILALVNETAFNYRSAYQSFRLALGGAVTTAIGEQAMSTVAGRKLGFETDLRNVQSLLATALVELKADLAALTDAAGVVTDAVTELRTLSLEMLDAARDTDLRTARAHVRAFRAEVAMHAMRPGATLRHSVEAVQHAFVGRRPVFQLTDARGARWASINYVEATTRALALHSYADTFVHRHAGEAFAVWHEDSSHAVYGQAFTVESYDQARQNYFHPLANAVPVLAAQLS